MMQNILENLTDDEDFLELLNIVERRRAPKTFRRRENHFEKWTDSEFLQRFRLTKEAVRFLHENIAAQISSPTERNQAVTSETMVFVTLRYYATGSFLQVVGDFAGIDKATASRIVHKVSRTIASLHRRFIKMPQTEDEKNIISNEFYNISRFPRCIGALDCTHIKIVSPGGEEPETYRNRKGYFSMNVQGVCDAKCRILNIVCRWPGSTHDSTIFNNSQIRANFENREYENYLLVGDSGYGIKNYLITPLSNPQTPAENLFNESQIRTRNPVERCYGIWKRRFPILAFGIRLKLRKVEAVVISTAILHNIASLFNNPLPHLNVEEAAAIEFINIPDQPVDQAGNIDNNLVRYQLINDYFARLLN